MPILGGIMGPSVPAVATTIAENSGGYPFFFMKGTRTEPRAAESATAEPEIPAINMPTMSPEEDKIELIDPMDSVVTFKGSDGKTLVAGCHYGGTFMIWDSGKPESERL